MSNDFDEVMKKRSDRELIEIITKYKNDYQPDAILSAEKEIKRRNLTFDQIENAKQEIKDKDKEIEDKAIVPLSAHWKVFTFIFPGIINIIIGSTYKNDGYHRKFKELVRWTLYGVAFYFGLCLLMVLIFSLII